MSSEGRRKAGARFHYRAKRTGGRVVKKYCGSLADPVVALLARHERLSQAERRAEREADMEERRVYGAIEAVVTALEHQLRGALRQWMRLPQNPPLRQGRSRGLKQEIRGMESKQRRQPITRDEFDELVKRAEIGEADALAEIRKLLRADPATWRPFGDLTEHVKRLFLGLMVRNNIVARESLNLELEALTRELQQEHSSPLRKLVIDQILILWLDVHYQQTLAAEPREGKTDIEFLDRRLNKTRKRYFTALEALGRMDRILGLITTTTTEHQPSCQQ